jgi:hypothetical protein
MTNGSSSLFVINGMGSDGVDSFPSSSNAETETTYVEFGESPLIVDVLPVANTVLTRLVETLAGE